MAGSAVLRSPLSVLLYILAAVPATAAATPTDAAIDEAYAHLVNLTANQEYWAERAEAAHAYNRAAYQTDPVAVVQRFNDGVHRATATRSRSLAHRARGPCTATNPIDQCWRCRRDWARDRKRLARCAMGFGHRTTGGLAGKFYVVIDPSDDAADLVTPRKGTLRHAVTRARALWITFARDMVIELCQELIVSSDKTIDGRGAQVHIVGAQITLQNVRNVILHNLHVHDAAAHGGGAIRDSQHHWGVRGESDGDGVSVMGSSDIWIDHLSMSSCADGLVDAVDGSTAITVSNGHFTRHDHVMLFGASDAASKDREMQVTVAFNHFGKGLVQRMPRCRHGFFHVVNNDYTHWLMYAIGGSRNPTIISQGNRFRAVDDSRFKEVTKREYTQYSEYKNWVWKSQDDLFLNGAFFNQSGGQNERKYDRLDLIQAKGGQYAESLTRYAGALNCRVGRKC
ncbi:Pectate lyase precursor [Zea mays]|uniref:Pectate lyase n=1 Tax=Zea mays TaxID=4577 RepID=B6TPL1_MAIZE|nr:Pectate lyase precursor [Zea mays]ACG39044.1 pectate lyase precursor [Zea mays]ACR35178.1 unknown [Zea mays]AQK80371.1 putative pectate lyase 3 [Zea mays]|eukprot:NP_001150425.1 uncharacterized protein LOC100284055 precursor [Zea mays]